MIYEGRTISPLCPCDCLCVNSSVLTHAFDNAVASQKNFLPSALHFLRKYLPFPLGTVFLIPSVSIFGSSKGVIKLLHICESVSSDNMFNIKDNTVLLFQFCVYLFQLWINDSLRRHFRFRWYLWGDTNSS